MPVASPPRLSVNLNKIALLRNSRRTGIPDLRHFAELARDGGARGITLHPRPDERHVRRDDVDALARFIAPVRPGFELNIEGFPDRRLDLILHAVRPEQVTLVPDAPDAFTSERGWALGGAGGGAETEDAVARDAVCRVRAFASRVILFVDPDPAIVPHAKAAGADGIEIYTGAYAAACRDGDPAAALARCVATARAATDAGLLVNIGHDLNLANIPALIAALPPVAEASIGHELTADALVDGFVATVQAYRNALAGATA